MLAHEGRNWKIAAIVKLAPHELVVVAETGVPPAANEIIDVDLDDFPELPINRPHYERRRDARILHLKQNQQTRMSSGGRASRCARVDDTIRGASFMLRRQSSAPRDRIV